MTAIVLVPPRGGDKGVMAADNQSQNNGARWEGASKIVDGSRFIVGVSGDLSMIRLIAEIIDDCGSLNELCAKIKEQFRRYEFTPDSSPTDGGAPYWAINLLVVDKDDNSGHFVTGDLFHHAVYPADMPCAVGSGGDHAEGAAMVARNLGLSAGSAALSAIAAAKHFRNDCGDIGDMVEYG